MSLAFEDTFERGYREALLIGTDIPDLPLDVIHEAFSAGKTHDAVLGPARDGGYYLIGFRKTSFTPEIFNDMPWGAADVCARTMDVFRRSGKSVHMLPAWGDVDTARDLADLVERNGETTFRTSRTMTYIMENLKRENRQ
ncbi:MAG TPA: TIGR04282 family arsenosugar biosynthesis glycosyltransferase, partial [Dissulfurispiraceae bacterium]|nr:TIGR04282 family arsenosugar biosynthesis glycosyltransferase [Dissulfurispiraceae bacterium]